MLRKLAIALAALSLLGAGVSYSWTFTPIGRLDYPAAIVARLSYWQDQPIDMSPEARRASAGFTRRLLPTVPEE